MSKITIAGESVELEWTGKTARIMRLRLSEIGFDWEKDTRGQRMSAAMVKIAWALLPQPFAAAYPTHEDMFAAMQEDEDRPLFMAVSEILAEMSPSSEKKSSSLKSHSQESSSD